MIDKQGRKIEYMRISVTDRCNLRCQYCMPDGVSMMAHEDILSYEEILKICKAAVALGITRFKVTGGEPFVRKGILGFLADLKYMPGVEQVTVTTNGILLREFIPSLKKIGIDGVNVSLDSMDPMVYEEITGQDELRTVLRNIREAKKAGLRVKVNCVLLKGKNEDDIPELCELARYQDLDVRFIQLMPLGEGKKFAGAGLSLVRDYLEEIGPYVPVEETKGNGPAVYYKPEEFEGTIGMIDAIHGKFCDTCNRIRLTSDGEIKACLYYEAGCSLRNMLREGAAEEDVQEAIRQVILDKPKEHHFTEEQENEERKSMFQIGG